MSCGCQGSAPSPDATFDHRSEFAMCWTCGARNRCEVFAELTAGGRPFSPAGRTCPRGRWPDKEGYVNTALGAFIGVPFYVRWRLALEGAWAAFRQRAAPDYLPGCGCYAPLREAWDAFFGEPSFPPVVIDSRTFNYVRGAA